MIPTGVLSLIVFGLLVLLFVWDKLPMATSAFLGCAIMVLLGITDYDTAFSSMASSTVVMLIGVMIVGAAFVETGLANKIGNLVMKTTKDNEKLLIFISFLIAYGLSTFLTNVTVLAIFIPIIFAISATQKKIKPMNVVIPLTLAVNAGGITTLVGSSQQMTAQGLLEEYGYVGFKVFDFSPMGLILGFTFLVYSLTIGYWLGNKIWGNRSEEEIDADVHAPQDVEIKKSKVIAIGIIFFVMVFLYIFQGIPFTGIKIKPVITSVITALACIITGCISQKKAISAVNWNIVGRLAGCLGIAKALEAAGGIEIVKNWFLSFSDNNSVSPFLLFVIVVLAAQIVSLFISNSTAISVSLLLIMSIAPVLNLNVYTFAMGIVFSSSLGCCCPLSGSTWGVCMSAGYKFKDFFKYGLWIDLIGAILVIVFVPLLFGGVTVA